MGKNMHAKFALGRWALGGLLAWLCCLGPLPALAEPEMPVLAQPPAEGFFLGPKLRRLVASHTSYQFGDPDNRQINPLSRLEFPLDSWWGGLEVGYGHPHYSWRLELMTNISRDTDGGKFKDSDWERPASPGVLTTYSDSQIRLKPSLTLDSSVDYSLRQHVNLPQGLDLRPVIGLRYQRYTFETYDGVQISRPEGQDNWVTDAVLGGEYIWFRQEFLQSYLGLRLSAEVPLPRLLGAGRKAEVSLQGDWAYVVGANRDHHLLRGDRITEEHTTGDAWHASLGLKVPLGQVAFLGLSGDYLRIRTTGQHDFFPSAQEGGGDPESWDHGVKVWSDQYSLTLFLEIPFDSFMR
jgi:hypothetical protein